MFPRTWISKFPGGACPRTPLDGSAFGGPVFEPPFIKSWIRHRRSTRAVSGEAATVIHSETRDCSDFILNLGCALTAQSLALTVWRSNPAKNQLSYSTSKFNIQHPTCTFNIQLKPSTANFGTQRPTLKWTFNAYTRCRIDNDIYFFFFAVAICLAAGHGLKWTKCPAVRNSHIIATERLF